MHRVRLSISGTARALAAAGWGLACLCVLAAPVLASHAFHAAASLLYILFSRICHQIPGRSFALLGYPLAVCHRCSGMYLGMFLGCFIEIPAMHRSARARRAWVLGAALPLAADALAPAAGLWLNTPFSRFCSGLLFGIVISSLVARGIAEFAQAIAGAPAAAQSPKLKEESYA